MHERILRLIQYAFLFGVFVVLCRAQNAEIYTVSDKDSRQLLELKLDLEQAQKKFEERKAAVEKEIVDAEWERLKGTNMLLAFSTVRFSEDFKYATPAATPSPQIVGGGWHDSMVHLSCSPDPNGAPFIAPLSSEDANLGKGLWEEKERSDRAYWHWVEFVTTKLTAQASKKPSGKLSFNPGFTIATAEPVQICTNPYSLVEVNSNK